MSKNDRRKGFLPTVLVLVIVGFGLFCSGSLIGCSSDDGTTTLGPQVEDPVPPNPMPTTEKIPVLDQDLQGESDWF